MPRSINFVESRQKQLSQVSKKDSKTRLISFVTLTISFSLFLLVAGIRFFMQQTLTSLEAREETIKNQIMASESTERDYTTFAFKLQTLTKLFDARKDKQQTITYFNDVFGDNVIIREIQYSEEDQKVSFALQAKDIFTLDTVYQVFNSGEFSQKYPSVERTGLRREGTGVYIMNVGVFLDPKTKVTPQPTPASTSTTNQEEEI